MVQAFDTMKGIGIIEAFKLMKTAKEEGFRYWCMIMVNVVNLTNHDQNSKAIKSQHIHCTHSYIEVSALPPRKIIGNSYLKPSTLSPKKLIQIRLPTSFSSILSRNQTTYKKSIPKSKAVTF
ncbi:hypothetical protein OCU04_006067 [Sclerotinia nivalis]|uniref:Uncharacterized protein n=1 Tax=Sclerotinia nivalis TaxID=352851 RepID=A0A9X0AN40_9HELO|nr:hypothetical protein OCU04_006067 [Sclerotinia nivalis]